MGKIIIFSKHFLPDNFKINLMASELIKKGYEVDVLTSNPSYNYKKNNNFKNNLRLNKKKWRGVKIFYLPVFRKKSFMSVAHQEIRCCQIKWFIFYCNHSFFLNFKF